MNGASLWIRSVTERKSRQFVAVELTTMSPAWIVKRGARATMRSTVVAVRTKPSLPPESFCVSAQRANVNGVAAPFGVAVRKVASALQPPPASPQE